MTVFKTFLKVLNKCKGTVILYTVILVIFGAMQMKTSDEGTNFVASKPDVLIVNNDEEKGITKGLIEYLEKNTEPAEVEDSEEARDDALFYRDADYIIYIPKNYHVDFAAGREPEIEVKSSNGYSSQYAELLLERYLKTAQSYVSSVIEQSEQIDEDKLIAQVEKTLGNETKIEMTAKMDSDQLSRTAFYFNFMNYGLLAGAIFTICMILASFREEKLRRRTMVSSMRPSRHNRILLLSNALFALVLWAAYVGIGFLICDSKVMMSKHGLFYMLNSLVFTFCAVTIAFVLAGLIRSKNALNGIINVIALGSSFLCGAFVPVEMLPGGVLAIAHILPSYWYIQTNEALVTLEAWDMQALKPLFVNMGVVIVFSVGFIVLANVISAKRK